jgi:anti-sigma factor RsiW
MSPPIDPAELSALIDGELPPGRAREIEVLIAADPGLRAEYEALRGLDARWREAAGAAMFTPTVQLPPERARVPVAGVAAVVLVLLLARIGGKFLESLGPMLLLNLAALALIGAMVLVMARADRQGAPVSVRPG